MSKFRAFLLGLIRAQEEIRATAEACSNPRADSLVTNAEFDALVRADPAFHSAMVRLDERLTGDPAKPRPHDGL